MTWRRRPWSRVNDWLSELPLITSRRLHVLMHINIQQLSLVPFPIFTIEEGGWRRTKKLSLTDSIMGLSGCTERSYSSFSFFEDPKAETDGKVAATTICDCTQTDRQTPLVWGRWSGCCGWWRHLCGVGVGVASSIAQAAQMGSSWWVEIMPFLFLSSFLAARVHVAKAVGRDPQQSSLPPPPVRQSPYYFFFIFPRTFIFFFCLAEKRERVGSWILGEFCVMSQEFWLTRNSPRLDST
jgi:hypothetical protein